MIFHEYIVSGWRLCLGPDSSYPSLSSSPSSHLSPFNSYLSSFFVPTHHHQSTLHAKLTPSPSSKPAMPPILLNLLPPSAQPYGETDLCGRTPAFNTQTAAHNASETNQHRALPPRPQKPLDLAKLIQLKEKYAWMLIWTIPRPPAPLPPPHLLESEPKTEESTAYYCRFD